MKVSDELISELYHDLNSLMYKLKEVEDVFYVTRELLIDIIAKANPEVKDE